MRRSIGIQYFRHNQKGIHATRGPEKPATGLSRQSESLPSACSVELPSKDHIGAIFELTTKIRPYLGSCCVDFVLALYPSSQIYSNLLFMMRCTPANYFFVFSVIETSSEKVEEQYVFQSWGILPNRPVMT